MSGWDASSRRAWDPQDGDGDSTQAFSAPDIPESADDRWPEPSTSPSGSAYGGRHQSQADDLQSGRPTSRYGSADIGYEPGHASPPPDIFQQDYGQQGPAERDHARRDYDKQDSALWGQGASRDYAPRDYASPDRGQRGYAPGEYAPADSPGPDSASRESREYGGQDHVGQHADTEYAARMDPALQDFFAPKSPRPDAVQPGPAQQRYGTRGYAAQSDGQSDGRSDGRTARGPADGQPGDAQPRQPRYSSSSGQPSELGRLVQPRQPGQPGRLNDPARVGRRATGAFSAAVRTTGSWAVSRSGRRSLAVGATLAVIVLAIALVEFVLGGKNSTSASSSTGNALSTTAGQTAKAASPKASAKPNPARKPAAKKTGYRLAASATAGGYPRLTPIPDAVRSTAGATAQTIRDSIVTDGGKVTAKVPAAYQLSGGQVLAFTGYEGTFTPAKVIADLGAGAQTYAAGKDGGKLACFTASGAQAGTVCVWATTTTVGITEFFSSVGPEVVTIQSKAAADTLKFRDSVEHRQ